MEGRVLIVENDPTVLKLATDFLQYDGHDVMTAGDGEEGLKIFSEGEFDVVVTDVKMPKMDGIEMMKAIKALEPSIEVIVLTGYGTFEMTIEVIRNGGYDFLRKPDDVAQRIRPTVQRAIEKRRLGLKNDELVTALEAANKDLEARVVEKTQEASRLGAQHAVTRILAESTSLADATPKVITAMLDSMGWALGAIWSVDRFASLLRCEGLKHASKDDLSGFAGRHREESFSTGIGLPGSVWKSRQHVLVPASSDTAESNSTSPPGYSGIGFPVVLGNEVLGVIEFYNEQIQQPDENLLRMMTAIGSQLGHFIERERLEEQFRQSQKMEAIGRLAGGIAHDFNNLLTSVIGYAHLIEKQLEPNTTIHRNAGQIQKTGLRAASLIQQLLAFSRRQVLKPDILDVNDIISGVDSMLGRLLPDTIVLKTNLSTSLEPVFADQTQIEQVVLNLAVNARDAMTSGGILSIETSKTVLDEHAARIISAEPGEYVRILVNDTGHGMDESVQAHLFEPFFTTKPKGKGTGLGLATVYGIVTQSGGQITVKSSPNEGATFTVYLPVAQPDEAVDQVPEPPAIPVTRRDSHAGSETILLVEDEDEVRDMAKQIIEEAGYTVLEAENGIDALALTEKNGDTIHLVLTDVVMPMMNGDELAERLIRSRPSTRIIFMSGYADEALTEHNVFESGIFLLQKPFTPDDLLEKIREELDLPKPSHQRSVGQR
ncbi:MAG: response regulator [Candidatus Latescibacteria bacterium]|jgi:two-component system, cell cycle sensor histidine kinase and response regulator CckA|nr:response regulator [Candidatus Latescibacterota bacterium]